MKARVSILFYAKKSKTNKKSLYLSTQELPFPELSTHRFITLKSKVSGKQLYGR